MDRRQAIVAGIAFATAWRRRIGRAEGERARRLSRIRQGVRRREALSGSSSKDWRATATSRAATLRIVRRSADARNERLRSLAPELAAAKVDVILATSPEAARSAKVGAPGIATVFVISADPVLRRAGDQPVPAAGFADRLVTRGEDLTAKRLQTPQGRVSQDPHGRHRGLEPRHVPRCLRRAGATTAARDRPVSGAIAPTTIATPPRPSREAPPTPSSSSRTPTP